MPTTKSPLRYPGGKSQLYNFVRYTIYQNNIKNPIYIEPFAGGAGLAIELLLNQDVESIVINDIDIAIYSFWYSVLYRVDDLISLIEKTPITINEWKKQKAIYESQKSYPSLDLGFATFYLNRTNRSGIIKGGPIGGLDQSGKYKIDCRFNKEDLINKIRKISSNRDKIFLYNYDAVYFIQNVLSKFPSEQLFIFFDPPYFKEGKKLYTNFYTYDDHKDLCYAIKGIKKSHWINTYDYNKNIAELYKNIPTKIFNVQYSANRKRKEKEFLFHNPITEVKSFDKVQFIEMGSLI